MAPIVSYNCALDIDTAFLVGRLRRRALRVSPGQPIGHVRSWRSHLFLSRLDQPDDSGDGKTRRVGLSGFVASLVVAVPCVTRRVTGRFVRALRMICLRVCGGAGLAPAAGLIRSLSALLAY